MLRIHFTPGDMARTRVAEAPDPLWECVLSLHQLQERRPDPDVARWRQRVARRDQQSLRLLLPLVPPRGYFPDFLTPAESAGGFETGLDALLSTPRATLRREVSRLARGRSPDPWLRSVAEGRLPALQHLEEALRVHARAVAELWRPVRMRVEQDRLQRVMVQWSRGTEVILASFGTSMTWCPPVLLAPYPVDMDLHLEGRGLLLVPSYFCRRTPVALADPSLPPTLVYPAELRAIDTGPAEKAGRQLARLLGHTRAAVLECLSQACTTSELARRTGISVSSASEHAAVLRCAGLVRSSRRGSSVHHALTPLGLALLDSRDVPMERFGEAGR